jgi:hypothetical protein
MVNKCFEPIKRIYSYFLRKILYGQDFNIYLDVDCAGSTPNKKTNYSKTIRLGAEKSHSFKAQVDTNHSIRFIGLNNISKTN